MSGYSAKSLFDKLGLKEDYKVKVINPPANYFKIAGISKNMIEKESAKVNFIHCFITSVAELKQHLPKLKNEINKDGMLWISWPKKVSGVKTNVNENVIREAALDLGLVDVKVCAVDEVWSGLKLVYRLKDRG